MSRGRRAWYAPSSISEASALLVRVRAVEDLARLRRHRLDAPFVRAQQHEIVERVAVEGLQDVVHQRVARREQADRIQHGRGPGDEAPQVVEHPRDPLAAIEELRLLRRADHHLIAPRDQQLRDRRRRVDVAQRAQPFQPRAHQPRAEIGRQQRHQLTQLVPVLAHAADHVAQQTPARSTAPRGRCRALRLGHRMAVGLHRPRLVHADRRLAVRIPGR